MIWNIACPDVDFSDKHSPIRPGETKKELLIVRGKNFQRDLKLEWQLVGVGDPLKECKQLPTTDLEELGIVYLTSSPVSLEVATFRSLSPPSMVVA